MKRRSCHARFSTWSLKIVPKMTYFLVKMPSWLWGFCLCQPNATARMLLVLNVTVGVIEHVRACFGTMRRFYTLQLTTWAEHRVLPPPEYQFSRHPKSKLLSWKSHWLSPETGSRTSENYQITCDIKKKATPTRQNIQNRLCFRSQKPTIF